MATKPLNPDEITVLRNSPYVARVSIMTGRINFTPEFKKLLFDGIQSGKSARTVFEEHGIDPEILGGKRIESLTERLRDNAEREGGFEDLRKKNSRKPAKETREQTLAARVEQLEHELAYTRQEVEFLKKVRAADLEAQKSWESKQRRK